VIGEARLKNFENTWSKGFFSTISKKLDKMSASSKYVKIGDFKVYDLIAIYSRVIALLASDRYDDAKEIFVYELASIPTSMFTKDEMRICKAKSKLKNSLQVNVYRRTCSKADVIIIDGSALLWTIHWPADGTVEDFIVNVRSLLISYLTIGDVYFIFDRYHEYSIKSTTQDGRETGLSRTHNSIGLQS